MTQKYLLELKKKGIINQQYNLEDNTTSYIVDSQYCIILNNRDIVNLIKFEKRKWISYCNDYHDKLDMDFDNLMYYQKLTNI